MSTADEKIVEMSSFKEIHITIEDSKLSEEHKELLSFVFNKVKHDVESLLIDLDVSHYSKILQTTALIMKSIENVVSQKGKIAGSLKKMIALECGRMCIKTMKDHHDILLVYDSIAETALETMIDVSRHLNVKVVTEVANTVAGCCSFFK